jgi:hypothetical protein
MSGGHFNFSPYMLEDIADSIETDVKAQQLGEHPWPKAVVTRLKTTAVQLRKLAKMVHHADYLFSGDHGPESFLQYWAEANEFK